MPPGSSTSRIRSAPDTSTCPVSTVPARSASSREITVRNGHGWSPAVSRILTSELSICFQLARTRVWPPARVVVTRSVSLGFASPRGVAVTVWGSDRCCPPSGPR